MGAYEGTRDNGRRHWVVETQHHKATGTVAASRGSNVFNFFVQTYSWVCVVADFLQTYGGILAK